jgi:hypothetical protein
MSAWTHNRDWGKSTYNQYCEYVKKMCPVHKGTKEDCADLSVKLLIDFAAANGLPVSFYAEPRGTPIVYSSRATGQFPQIDFPTNQAWKSKEEFYTAVKRRINSKALWEHNTFTPDDNDISSGDLMVKEDHTALVFGYYATGVRHPHEIRADIPDFPGPDTAVQQLYQLEYFGEPRTRVAGRPVCGSRELLVDHVDYLNHRGEGKPKKEQAELIYFRSVPYLRQREQLEFKRFRPIVLNTPVLPIEFLR